MRLWHKDLIPVLPRKQLLGQWRECCLIAKELHDGKLNHLLVNKVKESPEDEFNTYAQAVYDEMTKRGYHADSWSFFKWRNDINTILLSNVFRRWHNQKYLTQCFWNLMEKCDCGGITNEEWNKIYDETYKISKRYSDEKIRRLKEEK